ncbi:cytokinin dehydrogenase 3-like protein [Tanacetum coccineum]
MLVAREKGSKDQSEDQDGSVLYLGDDHFALVHGKGSVVLEFSSGKSITLFNVFYVLKLRFGYYNNGMFMLNLNKVPDDSGSVYMSSSTFVNFSLWHARLGHVHYKRMLEMSKDDLIHAIDENPKKSMKDVSLSVEANATTGNAPGKPSYATATGKTSRKKVNVRTLYTPKGNVIDVVILVDSICAVSERFANTAYGFFLGKKVAYPVIANYKWHPDENLLKEDVCTVPVWVKLHGVLVTAFSEDGLSAIATKLGNPLMLDSYTSDMCMQSWGRSSYARVMIELRADVELKDNIVVVIPTITREGHYTCNVRVEYEWKPPRCSACKVFGHIHEECLKNIGAEYRPVLKKPTASSSGNKKKGVEPIIEVGNSNQFDVINSVDNDGEFGTNSSNTPIGEKIDKIERQICEGKLRLLDNDGNPLVPTGIVESDSEVEVVYDETANLRISTSGKDGSDKGYGTNNLLEQVEGFLPIMMIMTRLTRYVRES